jgi:hypothetical protein
MAVPHTLLITATIAPSAAMGETLRIDPDIRLADYSESLRWYLALPNDAIDRIVFLENSGFNLDSLKSLVKDASGKPVEFLSTATDTPPGRGKGYAESLMIEEGLRRSQLLNESAIFWKVTGRLRVLNMPLMVRTAPKTFDLYCDLRNVPLIGESLGGNQWMETRLFATTKQAYQQLFGGRAGCDYVIEKGFYRLVRAAMDEGALDIHPRFRRQPVLEGISGASGASYRSTSYRAKEAIRIAGRLLTPKLWL